MAYYKKYWYTFRDINNKKFTVEIHEDIDTQMTYSTNVVTYTNKNYIYVTGDISIYGIGDTMTGVGSGIPDGAVVTYIDVPKKLVYLNAQATTSNPPVYATLHKAVPVAEEVRADNNPFTIIYPELENKFQPIRGCGFSFNLVSSENMKFIGISTADMQKYLVKLIEEVQVTPIYTQDVVRFIGYLNSEIYEEPFEDLDGYQVNFTGNNGFALLDRFNYVSTAGNKYDTINSFWGTIFNTFYRIGLPYKKLYVGLSTTIDGKTIPEDETVLHHLYNNPDNWYNEDGDSESFRTVLEKLLGVLSAYIMTVDDNVYITDMNYILSEADDLRDFKVFDFDNQLAYVGTTPVYVNIGDCSSIGFKSNKQDYKIISGINKQVVKFNNYKAIDLLDYTSDEDSLSQQNNTEAVNLSAAYKYNQTTFDLSKTWNSHNGSNFIFYEGTGFENLRTYNGGCRFQPKTDGFAITPEHLSFSTKIDLPYCLDTSEYKLKLEAVVHPHTWEYMGLAPKAEDLQDNEFITNIGVHCEIIIDNEIGYKKKWYDPYYQFTTGSTTPWVDYSANTQATLYFTKRTKYILEKDNNWNFKWEYEPLNDVDSELFTWRKSPLDYTDGQGNIVRDMKTSPFYIPLNHGISGRLVIKLYDYQLQFKNFYTGVQIPEGSYTIPLWWNFFLKEFKVTVVDKYDNEVKKLDIEWVGDSKNSPISSIYKDEGETIENYLGTNINYPTDNASLLVKNPSGYYEPCIQLTRQGVTNLVEMLQLRSIISNYYKPFINLNLTTGKLERLIGYLTYNNYLPDRKFTLMSITRNIADASDEIQIQEFTEDNVEVNFLPNV